MIYDSQADSWEPVSNSEAANAGHGVGIRVAEMVARKGVTAVVTGSCGPKAIQVLGSAGVSVFQGAEGTVSAALQAYREGSLEQLTKASAPGRQAGARSHEA
jgi:predicted Fe-Mo cluster-binding NifX family protein